MSEGSDRVTASADLPPPWRWAGQPDAGWDDTAENMESVRTDDSSLPIRSRLTLGASPVSMVRAGGHRITGNFECSTRTAV